MAQKPDSETDMFSCGTCHKDFCDDDSLFKYPCGHALCDSCFLIQFRESKTFPVMCLVCRKKRRVEALNGAQVRQGKKNDTAEKTHDKEKVSYERCHEHEEELILYCFEESCNKPICLTCLTDHSKHETKRIETKEKEFLKKELIMVKMNLETEVVNCPEANEDLAKKFHQCIQKMRKLQVDIDKWFVQTIEKIECQSNQERKNGDEKVSAIRKNIELVNNIEEELKQEDNTNNERIQNYPETVRKIIENQKQRIKNTYRCKLCSLYHYGYSYFPVFEVETDFTEKLNRCLVNKLLRVGLPDWQNVEAERIENQPLRRFKTKASQLRCTGTCVILFF